MLIWKKSVNRLESRSDYRRNSDCRKTFHLATRFFPPLSRIKSMSFCTEFNVTDFSDSLITIENDLVLSLGNERHYKCIQKTGYPLKIVNWKQSQ
ncbi:MAG: hypothetical protein HQM08_28395 [Candidatus Riflebacteria bacterium]|nr:hypothetical protein [Candidatus Riflebacteria bacterium]